MTNRISQAPAAVLLGVLLTACASGRASVAAPEVTSPLDPCLVVPHPAQPRDTAIVVVRREESALTDWPLTVGDSGTRELWRPFLAAQVYEPLVRMTCDGRLVSGLAERWSETGNGVWRFVLRQDARFSDGTAVTAGDVLASWNSRMEQVAPLGAATREGENVLSVMLRDAAAGPQTLAMLSHIVRKEQSASPWPAGSGPFVVSSTNALAAVLRPAVPANTPVLLVQSDTSRDQRDILDRGADILRTRDQTVLDYARRSGFDVYPLPYDRIYVLALPQHGPRDSSTVARRVTPEVAASFGASLARDAVNVAARGAQSPHWFGNESAACAEPAPATSESRSGPQRSHVIMYAAGDPVARAIAERLVAIARGAGASGSDARVLAQIVPELSVAGAPVLTAIPSDSATLAAGSALAYVLHLPARVLAPCTALQRQRERGDWITPASLFPLIETRPFLVARAGAPAVVVDWDGTLRIQPSRRTGGSGKW